MKRVIRTSIPVTAAKIQSKGIFWYIPDEDKLLAFPYDPDQFQNSISKNGFFVGNFFGINDTWAKRPNMIFFSREEVIKLFSSFEIINLKEIEKDGKTVLGVEKHWHVLNVIAKKK